jgi:transmembrane sensor
MREPQRPVTPAERVERAAAHAIRLAEGNLTCKEQEAFEAWLESDPRNGEALEEIVGAWRGVEQYAASPEMVALRESALASARRVMERRRFARRPWHIVSAAAAALLVVVISGFALWTWLAPQTYQTGIGERRVVVLSDGSKLSLDGATLVKVKYASGFRRLWVERGRAKFDVAKDPLRPFSVAAADKVVVATGTAFSVELLSGEVRVVLYEGHVALLERNDDEPLQPVTVGAQLLPAEQLLTPGRELILAEDARPAVPGEGAIVLPADPDRSRSWEAGQLVFEDEALPIVVERMNRYADKPLIVGDAAAAETRISGVFRAGDTDALLQGLATAFNVQSRMAADSIVLLGGATP